MNGEALDEANGGDGAAPAQLGQLLRRGAPASNKDEHSVRLLLIRPGAAQKEGRGSLFSGRQRSSLLSALGSRRSSRTLAAREER